MKYVDRYSISFLFILSPVCANISAPAFPLCYIWTTSWRLQLLNFWTNRHVLGVPVELAKKNNFLCLSNGKQIRGEVRLTCSVDEDKAPLAYWSHDLYATWWATVVLDDLRSQNKHWNNKTREKMFYAKVSLNRKTPKPENPISFIYTCQSSFKKMTSHFH